MSNKSKYDWMGFWVHFFCGAVFGVPIGLMGWRSWFIGRYELPEHTQIIAGIIIVGLCSLFFGLIAGYFRDKFWTN